MMRTQADTVCEGERHMEFEEHLPVDMGYSSAPTTAQDLLDYARLTPLASDLTVRHFHPLRWLLQSWGLI